MISTKQFLKNILESVDGATEYIFVGHKFLLLCAWYMCKLPFKNNTHYATIKSAVAKKAIGEGATAPVLYQVKKLTNT